MSVRFHLRLLVAAMSIAGATVLHAQAGERPPDASPAPAPAGESSLTPDLFYRLLLGDVALQRGDAALAARAYIDAARAAGDPRLARRATEIAIGSRQRALVQEAAQLWTRLDSSAERPKRVLAALAA